MYSHWGGSSCSHIRQSPRLIIAATSAVGCCIYCAFQYLGSIWSFFASNKSTGHCSGQSDLPDGRMAGSSTTSPFIRLRILYIEVHQPPREVDQRPPRHNHNNRPVWHQTLQRTRLEPRPRIVERGSAVSFYILFGMWIVDNKKVSTSSGERTTHTNSVVLTTSPSRPFTSRLLVICDNGVGENFSIFFAFN